MRAWVQKLRFGTPGPPVGVPTWMDGGLALSAVEQAEFFARFAGGHAAGEPRTQEILRRILVVEERDGVALRAKTGTATLGTGGTLGWLAGTVEHPRPTVRLRHLLPRLAGRRKGHHRHAATRSPAVCSPAGAPCPRRWRHDPTRRPHETAPRPPRCTAAACSAAWLAAQRRAASTGLTLADGGGARAGGAAAGLGGAAAAAPAGRRRPRHPPAFGSLGGQQRQCASAAALQRLQAHGGARGAGKRWRRGAWRWIARSRSPAATCRPSRRRQGLALEPAAEGRSPCRGCWICPSSTATTSRRTSCWNSIGGPATITRRLARARSARHRREVPVPRAVPRPGAS